MKILILSDGQKWIVDRISRLIKNYLPSDEIDIFYCSYLFHAEKKASLEPVMTDEELVTKTQTYDLILFNNAPLAFHYRNTLDKIKIPKVVYVRSHRFIPDTIKYANEVDLLVTLNQNQIKEFKEAGITSKIICIHDGIEKSIFEENKLVAGFVGQPFQYKGCSMIAEVCHELNIKLALSIDRRFKGGKIDRTPEEMFDFYRSLDVYICMSEAEGTSMPVLEAYAAGVKNIISTRVGSAYEVLKNDERLIWIDRNKKELRNALKSLVTKINLLLEFNWESNIHKLREELELLK